MNILYLAHRIPYPPDKGDKIRSYHQLEHLALRHRVWCACFIDTPRDTQYVEPLRKICEDVIAIEIRRTGAMARGMWGLITGRTLTESYYDHRAMHRALSELTQAVSFDCVVAFSSSMAPYALTLPGARRVFDLCDLDSRKWMDYADRAPLPLRFLYSVEGSRLADAEARWTSAFDATILISDLEAQPLRNATRSPKIHVIGNGVDLPGEMALPVKEIPAVGFVGAMDYRPNIDAVCWFAEECWPAIRAAISGAEFRIVGRNPTRRVRKLMRLPGITVVGGVDNVALELARMHVSVAPMRIARGLQNKVLEAMAAAKPVVLTAAAAEGINATPDRDFIVSDAPEEISRNVVELLLDNTARSKIGTSAQEFVRLHHRWSNILDEFELVVTGSSEYQRASADIVREELLQDHSLLTEPYAPAAAPNVAK